MFLTRLDIFGFKSFPARLDLKFESGITAVVGPNGCGKTNIVDAIRWVLGEQKPSLLRSEQMEDVIFNGTARRKPLGMAEVSLTVDNSRGILPQDFTEVMITRRLFRSGESEYLLNKTPCRRKDIVELFMDTGMGPHAYSVIELSMVESILSGQTEALRTLFEEAAGIAKYKSKRRDALRKLDKTKDNLLRVGDILEEVERQVRSLRRQAAATKRYQLYVRELKELEVALVGDEYRLREKEAQHLRQTLEEAEQVAAGCKMKLTAKEDQAEKLGLTLRQKESALANLRAQLSESAEGIHRMEEKILIAKERRQGHRQQLARIASETEALQAKLVDLQRQREDQRKEAAIASQSVSQMEEKLAGKEEILANLDDELVQKRAAAEGAGAQIPDLLRQRNEIREALERLRAQREVTEKRADIIKENLKRTDRQLHQIAGDLRTNQERRKVLARRGQKLEAQLEESLGNRSQLMATLQRCSHEERQLESQVEITKHKLDLLQRVLETYEGYQSGVRTILTDLGDLPGIRGTVADALEVDPKFLPAVEAGLERAAQYILVETAEVAEKALKHLRERKAGRATFLILDRIHQLNTPPRPQEALDQKGALAWAPDVVTCKPEFRKVMDILLGSTIIVDSLASVSGESHTWWKQPITWASLDGDILDVPAILRGGHLSDEKGLLDRRSSLVRETDEFKSLEAALERSRAQRLELEAQEQAYAQEISELQDALRAHRPELAGSEKETESLEMQSKALSETRIALTEELEEFQAQVSPNDELLTQLTAKLSQKERQLSDKRENHQLLEAKLRELESLSRNAIKEVNEARVHLVSLQSRGEQLRLDEIRLSEMEEDLETTVRLRQTERNDIRIEIEKLGDEIDAKSQEVEEGKAERSKIEVGVQKLAWEESSMRTALQQLESELKGIRQERESVQDEVHRRELQLAEIEAKQQATIERIQAEYQQNIEDIELAEGDAQASLKEREERIQFLQERIRAIGPVNLAAPEEYDSQKKRHHFLMEQRNDLLQSEENLNQLIKEMNRRAQRLFSRTFNTVNQNFQSIFGQMFDGGEANLILNDGRDPLQADIDIYACPGGKRLRHIAQLSGGEKALTAISLLFALYQVKPSPFCVLDEVDAPLDDVNIGRFVDMLKSLSLKSQFIIITHNKNTMAAADVLYGVTMEESGVSKVVSVDLRQAEKSAAV